MLNFFYSTKVYINYINYSIKSTEYLLQRKTKEKRKRGKKKNKNKKKSKTHLKLSRLFHLYFTSNRREYIFISSRK